MIIKSDRKLTMTIDSNLKLVNLSTEQLYNLCSCFLEIANILDQVATDFENLYISDASTDELSDACKQASKVINKAKA